MATKTPATRSVSTWGRLSLLPTLAALLAFAIPAPSTAAGTDWANAVYSAGGAEIRVDERVFTLFAALNELGHDDAPISRTAPVPKREFHPVRQLVRDAVGLDPALRTKFEDFFDKNPLPIRSYLSYTLSLGPAPAFKAPETVPAELARLKGFEAILAEFHAKAKIQAIFAKVSDTQREALRRYATVVDKPIEESRKILRRPATEDSPHLIVVVNLLDADRASYGINRGDETVLVVGPGGESIDPTVIARAFVRSEVQALAAGKGGSLKSGGELFEEARSNISLLDAANLDDYVAESLARVVAIRAALPAAEAGKALDNEFRRGFVLVKELNRGLAIYSKGNKALDAFLGDFLREIDVARLMAALKGS